MMIHRLRLWISFLLTSDEVVECPLRWKTLHSELGHESPVEIRVELIGLLSSMPDYTSLAHL